MKRIFFVVISVLVGISCLRVLMGNTEPLTLTKFLRILSDVNFSFTHTLEQIAELRSALIWPSDIPSNIVDFAVEYFKWNYQVLKSLFFIVFGLLQDILDFLRSVLFFVSLLVS